MGSPRGGVARAGIESLEASDGAIQGVFPGMSPGSLILVSFSFSLVPRVPMHIYIEKFT